MKQKAILVDENLKAKLSGGLGKKIIIAEIGRAHV